MRMCFKFFVFHTKSGTTNNHRTELRNISSKSFSVFARTKLENLKHFSSVNKNRFEFFDFRPISSE